MYIDVRTLQEMKEYDWKWKKLKIRANRAVHNGIFKTKQEALDHYEKKENYKEEKMCKLFLYKYCWKLYIYGEYKTVEEAIEYFNEKERRRQACWDAVDYLDEMKKNKPDEYKILFDQGKHFGICHLDKFIDQYKHINPYNVNFFNDTKRPHHYF